MVCGAEMQLVQAVPDETTMVAGFEHRTLQCSGCDEVEQRLVFNPERAAAAAAEAASIAIAPPVSPTADLADASVADPTPETSSAPTAPDTSVGDAPVNDDASVGADVPVNDDASVIAAERPAAPSAWQRAVAKLRGRHSG
jgi:hypothetical protein